MFARLLKWINIADRQQSSGSASFSNSGTTKREREVANLLNRRLPGGIVRSVRFAKLGSQLQSYIDLTNGMAIEGGPVDQNASAQSQAEAIHRRVMIQMRA